MNESCEGCCTSHFCDLIMNGTTNRCPCKSCLVKMRCFDNCELYNEVYENIFGFKPGPDKGY